MIRTPKAMHCLLYKNYVAPQKKGWIDKWILLQMLSVDYSILHAITYLCRSCSK